MRRSEQRGWSGRRLLPVLTTVFAMLAGGCAGGGSEPATAPAEMAARSAAPGEVVALIAKPADASEVASYTWTQIGGEAVDLRGTSGPVASFVMPPLDRRGKLAFEVELRLASGEVRRDGHEVSAAARAAPHGRRARAVAPDFVVFTAAKDLASRVDLYLAKLDGSAVFRLNDPLAPAASVYDFEISPDNRYVAYRAVEDTGVPGLHVARTDGTGEVRVSSSLPGTWGVSAYAWAPDASRLAFLGHEDGTALELYTVLPDGTSGTKVSGPLALGGNVYDFGWAPDGSRLAYSANQLTVDLHELFTSRPDGTGNVRVSGPVVAGGWVLYWAWDWAPDSSRLAYLARQLDPSKNELFTSRPDGTGNVRVSGPQVGTGEVADFSWAPGAGRIAYTGAQASSDVRELYSSLPDGTGNAQVSGPVHSYVSQFLWSPDGARIAYTADSDSMYVFDLYVSGADGSSNVRVSRPSPYGAGLPAGAWSPDASRLAYQAWPDATSPYQIYTVRPDGTGDVLVSAPLGTTAVNASSPAWDPTSKRIGYLGATWNAQINWYDHVRLYTNAADGSQDVVVSPSAYEGDVTSFAWNVDGTRLVYRANQLLNQPFELFVADPTGGVVSSAISGPIVDGGGVYGFQLP